MHRSVVNQLRPSFVATLLAGIAISMMALACGPSSGVCNEESLTCNGVCVDPLTDSQNCGGCGITCAAGEGCTNGVCVVGGGSCEPGTTEMCYSGPTGTAGIGLCRAGMRTCADNGFWGACVGEVTPASEVCTNGADDDCNGLVDDEADQDGDGWTNCGGDCCDAAGTGCADPELVNPGAFEVADNLVDDDCDGVADNVLAACDTGLASNSGEGLDYAAAVDLCQTTEENPPLEQRRWGVISARLTRADGSGSPATNSRSIRPDFGSTSTRFGNALAVLSTGRAADFNDTNPDYAGFQPGQTMNTTSGLPDDWYAANGNSLPNAPGCPAPDGAAANDPVMLELRVRVPTNARSFSLDSNFFSAEYPEWTCSPYNDFFVVLLDSAYTGDPANPTDKNLARYTAPNGSIYPVGVNLAFGNTGLFQVCENGATGCEFESVDGSISTCTGITELMGTGFDLQASGCGSNDRVGGGTGWLATSGNVVPGEIITLRIAIWDTSDHRFDSVVLLDNFQWSVDASDPGTVVVID